ncbi:hypothetical protein E2C01_035741 [Portunus trituberculatus]|uniref:Uncharacterized protein n=1 Tax=Portunus trituberculatus TaxID=210409 RepID=A0A5B7F992_PORTR|nr:hypothetical protein [Portunus trituberculatus]
MPGSKNRFPTCAPRHYRASLYRHRRHCRLPPPPTTKNNTEMTTTTTTPNHHHYHHDRHHCQNPHKNINIKKKSAVG